MEGRPFRGPLLHLPGVSCDNFSGENRNNDQFFLSHCHTDHMIGLDDAFIIDLRRKNRVKVNHKIFCSTISKVFLVNKFKTIKGVERFISDEISMTKGAPPVVVRVFDRKNGDLYKVNVSCVTAGHCPGSVMFLFQKEECGRRILYTGDFRLENVKLPTLTNLHSLAGEPLKIDVMYLDTTFCSKEYENFPLRDHAYEAIWELVNSWIRKNGMYRKQRPPHVVLLKLPAQHGSAAILKKIYEQSQSRNANWKIHVSQDKQDEYLFTNDLVDFVDSRFENAQWIHACSWAQTGNSLSDEENISHLRQLPCCAKDKPFTIRQIIPCDEFFNGKVLEKGMMQEIGGESFKVCYSGHSSLNEIKEFLRYFQPSDISPIVLPRNTSKNEVMSHLLPIIGKSESVKSIPDPPFNEKAPPVKKQLSFSLPDLLLPSHKRTKRKKLDFESSDSLIKSKRRRLQWSSTMPARDSIDLPNNQRHHQRRASLPPNFIIPDITITPSTPSPLHQQELEDTTSFELRLSKDSSWKTLEENVEETIS